MQQILFSTASLKCILRVKSINLYKDPELPSSPVIHSHLLAQVLGFLPLVYTTFETLQKYFSLQPDSMWFWPQLSFSSAFSISLSFSVARWEHRGCLPWTHFSLWAVALLISPADNHCLHPGRPEDMLRSPKPCPTFFSPHPDSIPVKLKRCVLGVFQRLI